MDTQALVSNARHEGATWGACSCLGIEGAVADELQPGFWACPDYLGCLQQLGHEGTVADELQPGKGKARHADGLQVVQGQANGLEVPAQAEAMGGGEGE